MLAQQRPAGVPDGLSPDELERWSNELVAFLASDGIPPNFRAWARGQADLIDAYMASAEDFESEASDKAAPAVSVAAVAATPASKTPRQNPPRSPAAATREPGTFVLRVPEQIARLSIGITIGALAVFAIFGVRAMTNGSGGGAASLPASASGTPVIDQARVAQLQAVLAQNPADKDALFELGEIYFDGARFEDSISTLTKLVALDPQNKNALTDIGTANFNLGRPDQAKDWWQKVLTVDANDVQAHYNMGFVYANAEPRDIAAAVNEWETVVRLDPTSQLGQTAKVHVEGLKTQLTTTPAVQSAATPTPVPATP